MMATAVLQIDLKYIGGRKYSLSDFFQRVGLKNLTVFQFIRKQPEKMAIFDIFSLIYFSIIYGMGDSS